MLKFNPLIEKKIKESDAAPEIKNFLIKALLLELQSYSSGERYTSKKQLELYIKDGANKYKEEK